jgi:serine/threonine-protein kinase
MSLLGNLKSLLASKRCDIRQRFEIIRESTAGTMSSFYQARERETGKMFGVKVLDPEKTAAFEARFKGLKKPSEGEIATSLVHPNIVKTFEHGLTTKGEPYLVMEYLDGPNFNVLINASDTPLEGLRLPLIRQVAEALKAVHAAGYIHRDICPRNVMVDPETGALKLIDFGLTLPAKPEFMQPGNRTGNPNYMAPELVRRMKTDQRIDVFAFGVTAYEICTAQLPWPRGIKGDVAMQHATHPPTDIFHYRPQLNQQLGRSIMRCLEKEPEKRCPSMDAFLKMIKDVKHEDAS